MSRQYTIYDTSIEYGLVTGLGAFLFRAVHLAQIGAMI